MKKLLFAIAGAAAFAAMANDYDVLGFEDYVITQENGGSVVNKSDTGSGGDSKWDCQGDDASTVKAYDAEFRAPSITEPAQFSGSNTQYLNLDTNGSELKRLIPAAGQAVAADGTYIDTLVQFTPSESKPTAEDLNGAKLAIWLSSENNVTNLMVAGGFYTHAGLSAEADPQVVATNYTLSGTYEPGTWYRLTVKAIASLSDDANYRFPGFQISIDGTELTTVEASYDADALSWLTDPFEDEDTGEQVYTVTPEKALLLTGKKFIPSADTTRVAATLTSVGFKGTGALDDFVVTDVAPEFGPAAIDFQLTWPAGLTASYKIGDDEPVALTGAGSQHIQVPEGSAVQLILQNADGATKTYNVASASSEANAIDASAATFGWPEYLGDAVDGAYEIDNLAELKLFQKGIAVTTNELKLATAGETFKLTADIALDAPWPGVGVQNGKDIYSTADFNAAAFQGTFDGQNHTISGFQMIGKGDNAEGLDYCGFFNSTYGATIQNLKIAYAGSLFAADTTASTKESGATFVGVAKNSTLRNLTTLAGTVSCSKGFGGIVGYLTSGTTVDSCTNNVNMTSLAPNKCGGIAMITQNGSAVTISNCQNNGTIAGSGETGSLVGFVGLNTTFTDCDSTVAYKLFHHNSGTVTVSGIKGNATVVSYSGTATPGLNFATVSGSVATFVADDTFALNGAYKVMAPATATFAFAEAGTISFDTNLVQAVTFAITAAQGLDAPTETTENGVVTFTVAAAGGDDYAVEIEGSDVVITPSAEDLAAVQAAVIAGGGTLDVTDVAAVNAAMAAPIGTTGIPSWQALFLGVAPTEAGLETVAIKSVSFDAEGKVVVEMADGVDLKTGRGVDIKLKLMGSSDLTNWTQIGSDITNTKTIPAITPGSGETKKFYKVVVDFAGSSN